MLECVWHLLVWLCMQKVSLIETASYICIKSFALIEFSSCRSILICSFEKIFKENIDIISYVSMVAFYLINIIDKLIIIK